MKHEYQIIINDNCRYQKPIIYQFGSTKNIRLILCTQKATLFFEMGVKKQVYDFEKMEVSLFKDAYRKLYLLHSIKYGETLKIKRITILIDGEAHELPVGAFNIYSMLEKSHIELPVQWKTNFFLSIIANYSKNSFQYDRRFSALFSYLTSKCRSYETDRFINLWTAMNAYYGYISESFIGQIHQDPKSNLYQKADKIAKYLNKECVAISNIMFLLNNDTNRPSTKDQHRQFHNIERLLPHLTRCEIIQLYNESFSLMNGNITQISNRFAKLNECSRIVGVPLFLMLLLELPYFHRCNYLHGDKPLLILSYERDTELGTLRVINYFLSRFLGEAIPLMFKDDFLTESQFELLLAHMNKNDNFPKLN